MTKMNLRISVRTRSEVRGRWFFLLLLLCALTNRLAAATITVNSTADNTTTDGACTLREAILSANAAPANADCTAGSGSGAARRSFSSTWPRAVR